MSNTIIKTPEYMAKIRDCGGDILRIAIYDNENAQDEIKNYLLKNKDLSKGEIEICEIFYNYISENRYYNTYKKIYNLTYEKNNDTLTIIAY